MNAISKAFMLSLCLYAKNEAQADNDLPFVGGPGYAKAINDVLFEDDFSNPNLDARYLISTQGLGGVSVEDDMLVSRAGPSSSVEFSALTTLNRIFFPTESFSLTVKVGVGSESSGSFFHAVIVKLVVRLPTLQFLQHGLSRAMPSLG